MVKQDFVCTKCPMGCGLTVEDFNGIIKVTGNSCNIGKTYGENEYKNPVRIITTSMKIDTPKGIKIISVKTNGEIPKSEVSKCLGIIKNCSLSKRAINIGDVLISNINNLNVDIVATRNI